MEVTQQGTKVVKSTNPERVKRLVAAIAELNFLNEAEKRVIGPILDQLRKFGRDKAEVLAKIKEMALDEGINPDFLKIQANSETNEITVTELLAANNVKPPPKQKATRRK